MHDLLISRLRGYSGESVDLFAGAHGLLGEEGEVCRLPRSQPRAGQRFSVCGPAAAVEGIFEIVAGVVERGLQLRFGQSGVDRRGCAEAILAWMGLL